MSSLRSRVRLTGFEDCEWKTSLKVLVFVQGSAKLMSAGIVKG